MTRFANRLEAAALLAERLAPYRGQHPLVLGVPRGAVPMASLIAKELGGDLDVVLVRKLRAPGQPELAIGAIDEEGRLLRGQLFATVAPEYVAEETHAQLDVLRRRRELYTGVRGAHDALGRTVIIVDDGIATGSSMLAAVRSIRARHPRKIVVAVGVAPPEALVAIRSEADEVVCLRSPDDFYAVGQFFSDFSEVTDDDVVDTLACARPTR